MAGAQLVIRVSGFLFGSLILAMLLSLVMPLWLAYVCYSSRSLQCAPDKQSRDLSLGQPRLLPTQVSHTRLGAGRYNYTVPHFLVGTPVGLHGHVGSLLSIDEPERHNQNHSQSQTAGLMQYLNPKMETWFTVHAHHHLEKGNDSIGLEGKLHNFLVSQGHNPDEWPYAYLVTMPQFLGYQRNLVCIWYLYSASRELTAMIMEVNNYWGQRKIAFSRLTGEASLSELPTSTEIPSGSSSAPFYHSNPRHLTYRGTWDKDMFISPFEKVEGTIALRFSDPLAPNTPLHITITLLSPAGKPRLIGRVFCPDEHAPVDPLTASPWSLLRFLPYWTGVLVITELLIIIAALRIRSKGAPIFSMPEVRPNNIPRDESDIERTLEPSFRAYLKHLVESSPSPLTLTYIPSKSHHLHPITFTSPSSSIHLDHPSPSITIQILTPQFYTSFPSYKDPISAFLEESRPSPLPSDPESCRIRINDPALFFTLLHSSPLTTLSPPFPSPPKPTTRSGSRANLTLTLQTSLISSLRATPNLNPNPAKEEKEKEQYFLDDFISTHLPISVQTTYKSALLRHLLAGKFAFGFHPLFGLYASLLGLCIQGGGSYLLLRGLEGVVLGLVG
ncbi:hypothetical protein BDW59DRAFT_158347 [Aspergillus cavernicola]|uniref:GPI transamidase component PIG-T n=1 Tax=Aspergillus cavernicola TaxID=176166 RepID=A0ABR4IT45_9EURO